MKIKHLFLLLLNIAIAGICTENDAICMSKNYETASQHVSLQERVTALEAKPITPVVGSCAKNGCGFSFFIAPVFWRMEQEGMEYAITGSFTLDSQGVNFYRLTLDNGKVHYPDFHWDVGVRLGIGYPLAYDGWDMNLYWTHFHDSVSDSLSVDGDPDPNNFITTGGSGEFISSFWVAKLFENPCLMNKASAHWKANINFIDLDMGREFYVSSFLALRPSIGLRNGWIHQKYNLFFLAYNYPNSPSQIQREIHVNMKNNFWGIGGKFGLNTRWFLGKGFSLFGGGNFSILEGRFHNRYQFPDSKPVITTTAINGGGPFVLGTTSPPYDNSYVAKDHVYGLATMADVAIGFRWDKSLSENTFCLGLWLGYEYNILFGQNRFMNHQYDFTLITMLNGPQQDPSGPNFFRDRGNLTASGISTGMDFVF